MRCCCSWLGRALPLAAGAVLASCTTVRITILELSYLALHLPKLGKHCLLLLHQGGNGTAYNEGVRRRQEDQSSADRRLSYHHLCPRECEHAEVSY